MIEIGACGGKATTRMSARSIGRCVGSVARTRTARYPGSEPQLQESDLKYDDWVRRSSDRKRNVDGTRVDVELSLVEFVELGPWGEVLRTNNVLSVDPGPATRS